MRELLKNFIQWIEGTADEYNLVNNWWTAYVGAFKRLIQWI